MDNNIQCYYYDEWIKIEKEKMFFIKEIEDSFINITLYPLKIEKGKLYKMIFYSQNINKIHDIKQCKIDIPRYSGYIRSNKFIPGDFTYNKLMKTLKKYYDESQIIDIYNFIPQQIFFIIMNEVLSSWNDCIISKTNHQLNIDIDHIERILTGDIYKNCNFVKKFVSKIKLYYDENFAVLTIHYF